MNDIYNSEDTKFHRIYLFFKFGPKSRLITMQQDGYFYMKRLKYFVDLERNTREKGKGDMYEARLFHATDINIIDFETNKLFMTLKSADFSDSIELNKPIFCMTAFNIFENISDFKYPKFKSEINMDKRMISDFIEEEEPYVLIIKDIEEFLKRIRNHLLEKEIGYKYELVKYRDTRCLHQKDEMVEFNTVFHKDIYFEYQKEFRIVIDKQVDDYYDFSIGNIEDISKLIPATQIIDGLWIEGSTGRPDLV